MGNRAPASTTSETLFARKHHTQLQYNDALPVNVIVLSETEKGRSHPTQNTSNYEKKRALTTVAETMQ